MTKKGLAVFGAAGVLGLAAAIGAVQLGGNLHFRAAEVVTWKHFSAIMPTDTSKGIREYWSDCVGGAPQFTAPEGITVPDATLTDDQKAYILSNPGDERVIPTLSEISSSVAKGLDGTSPFQGNDVTIAHAYTYLDEATKAQIEGADEAAIESAYETFNKYYSVLVDVDGLDAYDNTATSVAYDETYGKVLKVNASAQAETNKIENWTAGPDRKSDLVKDGIYAVRFAIYAPLPMEVSFINGDCNAWYDPSTGEIVSSNPKTSLAKGEWREFTIPTNVINELGSLHIRLYLNATSDNPAYGIPGVSVADTLGSAYVSEIIGIKEAYYADEAAKVSSSIAALPEKDNLTMWDGGDLKVVRASYEALSSTAKTFVNNLANLEELESAYSTKWTCLNTSWTQGKVNATTQIKSVAYGHDEAYGLYAELDASDSAWIVHFTPVSEEAVAEGAQVKLAIYKPEGASVQAYYTDNSWGNSGYVALNDGWNVVTVPSSAFLGGAANGVSIGLANAKEAAGYKFTPLYIEK